MIECDDLLSFMLFYYILMVSGFDLLNTFSVKQRRKKKKKEKAYANMQTYSKGLYCKWEGFFYRAEMMACIIIFFW